MRQLFALSVITQGETPVTLPFVGKSNIPRRAFARPVWIPLCFQSLDIYGMYFAQYQNRVGCNAWFVKFFDKKSCDDSNASRFRRSKGGPSHESTSAVFQPFVPHVPCPSRPYHLRLHRNGFTGPAPRSERPLWRHHRLRDVLFG